MILGRAGRVLLSSVVAVGLSAATASIAAPPASDLVPARSGLRSQAIAALSAASPGTACLTPLVQSMRSERLRATAPVRRAIAFLATDPALPPERLGADGDRVTARFVSDRPAFDWSDLLDDDANGRPDPIDAALSGANEAQRLLVGQLELPSPGLVEIVLGRLGSNVEGLALPIPGRPDRTHIWLDPSVRGGAVAVRRSAEHQFAHAVAVAAGLDPAWGEAFATWTTMAVEGSPDDRTLAALAGRFAAQANGLVTEDFEFAAGNAAWFAFLNDAYGLTAVKLAVEELGGGGSDQAALDRALRRATGSSIESALRDFQLWSLLVGSRVDGKHFNFASRLPNPPFAATADAIPAMSVQGDPPVGPMGQTAVLIRPDELGGGMALRFEGDMSSLWGADVLVVREDGAMQRVPFAIDAEQSGELPLPLNAVSEVILLIRNLDPEGRPARRYSWAASFERGFPAEFASLHAQAASADGGVLVSWETAGERRLLGFNVLRSRSDRDASTRVNPVWIPAVGASSEPAAYSFFDAGALPGVSYRYHIEAVTLDGLLSRSDAVALAPAP